MDIIGIRNHVSKVFLGKDHWKKVVDIKCLYPRYMFQKNVDEEKRLWMKSAASHSDTPRVDFAEVHDLNHGICRHLPILTDKRHKVTRSELVLGLNLMAMASMHQARTGPELGVPKKDGLPVVPAWGGAEVAWGLYYKTFLMYRTCMRRAPVKLVLARCVRTYCIVACCPRTWPARNHVAIQGQPNLFCTLHTALFTPLTSHFTLRTSRFIFSSHLKSCELFSPQLPSFQLFSSHPISSHMSSK